jgi:hypothetical protein
LRSLAEGHGLVILVAIRNPDAPRVPHLGNVKVLAGSEPVGALGSFYLFRSLRRLSSARIQIVSDLAHGSAKFLDHSGPDNREAFKCFGAFFRTGYFWQLSPP